MCIYECSIQQLVSSFNFVYEVVSLQYTTLNKNVQKLISAVAVIQIPDNFLKYSAVPNANITPVAIEFNFM